MYLDGHGHPVSRLVQGVELRVRRLEMGIAGAILWLPGVRSLLTESC